jgi:hypothetical protein
MARAYLYQGIHDLARGPQQLAGAFHRHLLSLYSGRTAHTF